MGSTVIDSFIETESRNAIAAWLLAGFVLAVAASSLLVGDLLWAGFAAFVCVLAVLPAVAFRSGRVTPPWEVLALASGPLVVRTFGPGGVGEFATYLSVAAIALLVAVELNAFTPVRMTSGFAVAFVVIATMATAGAWAVVRWIADLYLATGFLGSEEALMWEFVASTAAGIVAGIVFELYFRRYSRALERPLAGETP
ncbi:hypothetical protein [Halalkalicoccus jeotgali]|uniref:Uncharacterized protein n=1 Tax=Halalkalicoccus jeotgali (strain DSM 18796 / CECT 7217 / JCM 14584 / KCTC 4019 / B3) TaxID=795797 RepID=D8JA21_HALJB|nr:hypothetical protein [Halalkalicoccus jeotgali]ADJ14543.1 hypothetical protein HacjB3_05760 [Halalkalicoccus jeotgali B3]ELY40115.1 hypothetical protein C497_04125 [Halalkalicoccus jeotgali B3]